MSHPIVDHPALNAVFFGSGYDESWKTEHGEKPLSIWQFKGIKYGKIPARFMQAELNEEFEDIAEAYHYGYIILRHFTNERVKLL